MTRTATLCAAAAIIWQLVPLAAATRHPALAAGLMLTVAGLALAALLTGVAACDSLVKGVDSDD